PLSGGHDSRIIVNSLKKAGIENVICYSYGTSNNLQSKISKQVAEGAGYPWHFVEYTEEKWGNLHKEGLIDEYIDYSFQGVSNPHLQDLLAVYELKQKGVIINKDIFIPGHSGITEIGFTNKTEQIRSEEDAFNFILKRQDYSNILRHKELLELVNTEPKNYYAYLNWQERQSKFIANSCRVYEFFGFDFRLPFWDREFVEFWLTIAPKDRLNRNLLLRCEREGVLTEELSYIPFDDEINNKTKDKVFAQILKNVIPTPLKILLLRLSG